jgi:hypothetical protein
MEQEEEKEPQCVTIVALVDCYFVFFVSQNEGERVREWREKKKKRNGRNSNST